MVLTKIKKKRVSKKNKVSWRKHVNIDDVEEFLEEKRLEERLGPPLATLSDSELFHVDVRCNLEEKPQSLREKNRLKLLEPKSFSALRPSTNVPDPIKKRNTVKSREERKSAIVKRKERENLRKGILKHSELQSIKDRKAYELSKTNEPKRGEFNENLWHEEELSDKKTDGWVDFKTERHHQAGTGKLRKRVLKSVTEKKSILPSVELPHPGMSYNPSFDDHQDLLKEVANKEIKIIKNEEHLTRVTKGMFSKVTENQRDSAWLEEMSQGLPSQSNEVETNSELPSDDEYKSVNPPVQNKKKTLKQRRKQKEQLELERERKMAKLEKKKIADLHKLKQLDKELQKKEKKCQILRQKRLKVKELNKTKAKRLGALKFEEADLDFNMGEDIAGNLRNLKKEGNLLFDRFNSLQKRNILQPTKKRVRKKAKVKKYTKPGYKDDWKKTVAK